MEFLNKETEALLQECVDNSSKFPKVLADKFDGLTDEEDRRLRSRIKTLVDNGYFSKLQWADNVPWFGSITEEGYDYFYRKNEYARRKIIEVYSFDLLDEEIEKILFDTLNKNVVLVDITNENVCQAVCKLEEENYITIDKNADVDPGAPYEIVRSWGISITQKGKDYFLEKDRLLKEILGNDTGVTEQVQHNKVFEFEKIDSNNKYNKTQDIFFNGILGNDCGTYEEYVGSNKKLKQKGFVVKDGIPTLRGFAKISDLAAASQAKYAEYQREKNQKHISEIKEFFDHCKSEAKFLPEVVLSVNSSENAILTKYDGNLPASASEKIKGIFDNLDYYTLIVKPGSLSRVDGNHRLEAGSNSNLYVPFSIILWNINNNSDEENLLMSSEANNNTESESFLFYILNNTAQKLEAEENFKGLVKSQNWTEKELALINRYLPLLKHYNEKYIGNPLVDNNILFAPLSQVCEALTEINDSDIGKEEFDVIFCDSVKIINQSDKFLYCRKEFISIFFQLAFYTRYKSSDYNSAIHNLNLVDKWLEKYKYTSETFTKASKIYNVAYKFVTCSPKTIFMAMEYKSEQIVADYNGALLRAVHTINNMGGNIEIEAYPIMTGRGKSVNITSDIYAKIENCSIFIADTTEANPNVMYELGIAYDKKKPIIMVREKGKHIKVPSDIISEYYYNFNGMTELENLFVTHIIEILIKDYGAVFPN